jgi:hypothetical protein
MVNKFILLITIITCVFAKLDKDKVVYAVNCGGDEYISEDGIKYEKVRFIY